MAAADHGPRLVGRYVWSGWVAQTRRSARAPRRRREAEGSALLPVLLLMLLFSAVALGLSIVIRVEIAVADRFVQSAESLYAAEAGLGAALAELRVLTDWSPVLGGMHRSPLSEGAFSGSKAVPRGGEVMICCTPQSAAGRLAADTAASPLPARRAVQWQPFLWATLQALAPADPPSRFFLVVWVADDETDGDADTRIDANGVVIVRAEALAPGGLRRMVEAYVARASSDTEAAGKEPDEEEPEDDLAGELPGGPPGLRILAWREVR